MKTPVLLLIFRRPDTTRTVLEAIRRARPPRLYVAADGPRPNRPGDNEDCRLAREVATEVDWPCEVRTLFRDTNLGVRRAVSSALDWFFQNEPQGIVLEDDCLPSVSFFPYCEELLDRYRDDERVMCVSGNNFQKGNRVSHDSYYFSRFNHCWGWASWRRAWALYDRDMANWASFRDYGGLEAVAPGEPLFQAYWRRIFDRVAAGEVDSWAYVWTFSCWSQDGLTCLPEVNLVRNIGFSNEATNTSADVAWEARLPLEELGFPLRHPSFVARNVRADRYTDVNLFGIRKRGIAERVMGRLRRALVGAS